MMTFDDINAKYGKALKHWVDYFSGPLKVWQTKLHGSKPTAGMLIAAVALTNKHRRPGRECLSTAMQLRPEGSTVAQYSNVATIGFNDIVNPANNKRQAIVKARHCTETVTGKPYNFHLAITPAGEKFMLNVLDAVVLAATPVTKAAQPAAAPAAKAKPVKVKKAKAKPADTAVTVTAEANATPEATPVAEGGAAATTADLNALARQFNS